MPFDPYYNAKEVGDMVSLEKWQSFAGSLDSNVIVGFKYSPFLTYQRPTEVGEYGPLPEVWVDSTNAVMAIFANSLSGTLAPHVEQGLIQQDTYVPPQHYQRGGPISFPMELLQIVIDNPWLLALGPNVLSNAVYDAMKLAYKSLAEWFSDHHVPEADQRFPAVSPFVIRAVAEGHAREFFPKLDTGDAKLFASDSLDADYPTKTVQFLVALPYRNGAVVYFVDNYLKLTTILRTYPGGFMPLRSSGWPRHMT